MKLAHRALVWSLTVVEAASFVVFISLAFPYAWGALAFFAIVSAVHDQISYDRKHA